MKRFRNINGGILRDLALVAAMLPVVCWIQFRSGGIFLTGENLTDLLKETAVLGIMAAGMMPIMLTGGIDLSVGSVMALGGMLGATLLKECPGIAPAVVLLVGCLTGTCCGLFNGFLTARLRILPIIATLGTMYAFRGLTYLVANGRWILQGDMGGEFLRLASGSTLGVNNLVAIELVVYVVGFVFLSFCPCGRNLYAAGSNPDSARVCGINVDRTLLLAYALTGMVAGFAGILYVCDFGVAQGESASGYEMSVIAACVLGGVSISGGTGRIQGVFLGSLFLGILNNAMPLIHVSPFFQEAIRGGIILFSIVLNVIIARRIGKAALERRRRV
ncbi:MAG: ABC transporter permease [Victivallaceae bacterium]|nr:ABC transporter permease [Victivallaceae bacterium]